MKIKHTKGKWEVSTHADNSDIVIRSEKGIIANCSVDASNELSREEQFANAEFMKTASEMLEALQTLVELYDSEVSEDNKHFNAIWNAKQIIKKATS